VIVQWCCRGIPRLEEQAVREILLGGMGLQCPPLRAHGLSAYGDVLGRLTETYLDLHVNHYDDNEPGTSEPVRERTPFISMSAGTVEPNVQLHTNVLCPARRTGLRFATTGGRHDGWLFIAYVLVGTGRATRIPGVGEEVRDLHHGRRYSAFRLEGEVAAKINVPSAQILAAERWTVRGGLSLRRGFVNPRFVPPDGLLNQRTML
jgi:hypothetical protein